MGSSINLRQLEVFAAIMRTGTVTAAAQQLGLTQPAVSKIIQHAESQLGIRLFQRSKGRLEATAGAREIFPAVDSLFQNAAAIQTLVDDLRDSQNQIIRVAATETVGAAFLPAATASFLASRHQMKVGIKIMDVRSLAPRVASQQVDLAISYAPAGDGITAVTEICSADVVCVVPRLHKLAGQAVITPQDLAGQRIISIRRDSSVGAAIHAAFAASGVRRNVVVETGYSHLAYDLVAKDVGVAITDPFTIGHHRPQGVVLRPFHPAVKISVRILHHLNAPLSRVAQEFIRHLRKAAKEALLAHQKDRGKTM